MAAHHVIRLRSAAFAAIAITAGFMAATLAAGPTARGVSGTPLLTVGIDVKTASLSEATYTIQIANRGSGTATPVTVGSAVPANTTFSASSIATTASCQDDADPLTTETCSWALGEIAPGSSRTIEATYTLLPQTTAYAVTLTATAATGDPQFDSSDTDSSLRRESALTTVDTFVDDTDPIAAAEHGKCKVLRLRGDRSATAFVRYYELLLGAGGGTPVAMERLWGAEIRAKIAQAGTPTTMGAHRVTTPWSAGDSDANSAVCPGASGTGDQPRKGWRPPSAATATSNASFSGIAGDQVVWDVTADMDTADERTDGRGWELIDEGGGTQLSVLHANEATAAADKLNIFIVFTVAEPPTCVEIIPAGQSAGSYHEAVLTARLTDGVKTSSTDRDACTGAPASGHAVDWQIDDDVPDTYVSSRNGVPTSQQVNATHTTANAAGEATIGLRLVDPGAGTSGDAGNSSVVARIEDPSVATATNEDSGFVAWTWEPKPPSPPSSDGSAGTGSSSETAASPTSGNERPERSRAARTIRANAPRSGVPWGSVGLITGQIASAEATCAGGQKVELHRRLGPSAPWEPVARVTTSARGTFSFDVVVKRSAEYAAVAAATPTCADAVSAASRLIPLIAVSIGSRRATVASGRLARIFGTARPASAGRRAILERKAKQRWLRVAKTALDRRGRYRFAPGVNWSGRRVFRVRVPSRSAAYRQGTSERLGLFAK